MVWVGAGVPRGWGIRASMDKGRSLSAGSAVLIGKR